VPHIEGFKFTLAFHATGKDTKGRYLARLEYGFEIKSNKLIGKADLIMKKLMIGISGIQTMMDIRRMG